MDGPASQEIVLGQVSVTLWCFPPASQGPVLALSPVQCLAAWVNVRPASGGRPWSGHGTSLCLAGNLIPVHEFFPFVKLVFPSGSRVKISLAQLSAGHQAVLWWLPPLSFTCPEVFPHPGWSHLPKPTPIESASYHCTQRPDLTYGSFLLILSL